jgi:hypothetical protein
MDCLMDPTQDPIQDQRAALILEQNWGMPELEDHTVGWSLFNFIESSGL